LVNSRERAPFTWKVPGSFVTHDEDIDLPQIKSRLVGSGALP